MTDHDPTLLLEMLEDERTTNRRRETFFVSVIIHLLLVLVVVTQPGLFRKFTQPPALEARQRIVTPLIAPPEPSNLKTAPKTRVLSDTNRKAQEGSRVPPPVAKAPLTAPPAPPPPPKAPDETKLARQIPPIGLPEFPESPKPAPQQRKPTLESIPPPPTPNTPSQSELTLPQMTPPGRGTDAILRGMAKDHASGRGDGIGGGGGVPAYDPQNPNLNMPGPQIISDTMGVDFNAYLLRVLSLVRRNWYTVIPEIARLGKQGRVVLEFTILKTGSVSELLLRAGSGTDSLDGAALSSIRLSNPLPPLPPEFPGQEIKLRFIYLYNMRAD